MHVRLREELRVDAELLRAGAQPRAGGLGRLAHHVAQRPGELKLPLARHARGLDEQDVAAGRRPGEPHGDARLSHALRDLRLELHGPQQI